MEYDGWEVLKDEKNPQKERKLGKGGQGTVYLVREPKWAAKRQQTAEQIKKLLTQTINGGYNGMELADCFSVLINPESATSLAALKVFDISSEEPEEQKKAIGRLTSEINALKAINHPAVLKLLHSNLESRFIVTQYHSRGPLSKNLNLHLFKGNSLAALKAFSPLLAGVEAIHKQGAIHRDIKTDNIFVSDAGDLVLGDFGIVFFEEGDRLTSTFERVGTRGWMAPWAQDDVRLLAENISPQLDIYPLAKVLWSMIAGRNGFQFWDYNADANSLEKLFPQDQAMELVNALLAKCIVRHEKECRHTTIASLKGEVDALIHTLSNASERLDPNSPWHCRVCGKGRHVETKMTLSGYLPNSDRAPLRVYMCNQCGHTELFDLSNGQILRA